MWLTNHQNAINPITSFTMRIPSRRFQEILIQTQPTTELRNWHTTSDVRSKSINITYQFRAPLPLWMRPAGHQLSQLHHTTIALCSPFPTFCIIASTTTIMRCCSIHAYRMTATSSMLSTWEPSNYRKHACYLAHTQLSTLPLPITNWKNVHIMSDFQKQTRAYNASSARSYLLTWRRGRYCPVFRWLGQATRLVLIIGDDATP